MAPRDVNESQASQAVCGNVHTGSVAVHDRADLHADGGASRSSAIATAIMVRTLATRFVHFVRASVIDARRRTKDASSLEPAKR